MPRKVNYGPDYDDYDYDYGYDDYDYDYDADVGGNEAAKPLKAEKEVSKLPVWRCSICTYENDKKLTYCEICGVIPVSSVKNKNKNLGKGESTMAQSIFAPVLSKTPKSSTPLQEINKENKVPSQAFMTLPIVDDDATCFQASTVKTEIITSNLQKPNKDEGYGDQRRPVSFIKDRTTFEYNPEKWMLEQENGIPKQLNLAIVGHVDSGKSTLSGRMLHLLGHVSQKEMRKYEKEAKEKGKASFSYAWVMDECGEERERGVTMTVGVAYFDTKNYHVVLLDSPGHKDFVPNMISGATQADAAVLVVDASMGSFEAGMNGYGIGQTREHAQLIRSFGVECIVVLVNKMDVVGYSKERFDYIKAELGTFLSSLQFKGSCVFWVPASAMENQNLVKPSSDTRLSNWYDGPFLLEAIDSLQLPERCVSKPFCMPICDVIQSHISGQVAASGKLEAGAVRNGSMVLVIPSGEKAKVLSIKRDSHTCSVARAGDNVAITLQNIDSDSIMSGHVLCHPDFPVPVSNHLELKIFVLDISTPIVVGSQVEFHTHHAMETGRISKISSVLVSSKSKKVSKKTPPRLLHSKQNAVIEVALERAVCVEVFSKCRPLGRVFLRSMGNTVAVGTITRLIE